MSMELLFIDTGFQDRNSDLQDSKSNWTSLFRIVPASDDGGYLHKIRNAVAIVIEFFETALIGRQIRMSPYLPGRTGGESASQI
jgi:hypothetical protein